MDMVLIARRHVNFLLKVLGIFSSCYGFSTALIAGPISENSFVEPQWNQWDSLFIIAATGEPRWQAQRDSCEQILLNHSDSTIPFLLTRRLSQQTPRQRHYVERLFGLMSDSGRQGSPGIAIRNALDTVNDSLKPQLLYIASTMGDAQLVDLGERFILSGKTDIRRMAARVLGMYPRPASIPFLTAELSKWDEAERHQRVWALALLAPYPGCENIKSWASDSSLAVRQMVSHALSRCAEGNFSKLNLTIPRLSSERFLPVTPWLTYIEAAIEISTTESLQFAHEILKQLPGDIRQFYSLEPTKVYNEGRTQKP